MTTTQQRSNALQRANKQRAAVAAAKLSLRSGTLTLTDAMLDPPDALRHQLLIDIIRWTRSERRARRGVTELGRQAIADNINLMVTLEAASSRTRAWVAEHGYWQQPRRRFEREHAA